MVAASPFSEHSDLVIPHGIVMPKGFYFTAVVFSFILSLFDA